MLLSHRRLPTSSHLHQIHEPWTRQIYTATLATDQRDTFHPVKICSTIAPNARSWGTNVARLRLDSDHFPQGPDNSSQDTAALQPHTSPPVGGGRTFLDSQYVRWVWREFDQLFLTSDPSSGAPAPVSSVCSSTKWESTLLLTLRNEIASLSIASTFTFTEVALLECSESRLFKKLRICNSLPKEGKTTMTHTVLLAQLVSNRLLIQPRKHLMKRLAHSVVTKIERMFVVAYRSGSFCCRSLKNDVFKRQLMFTNAHAGPQQVHWICRFFVKASANWRFMGAHLIVAPRCCMHGRGMTKSKPQTFVLSNEKGTTMKPGDHTTIWHPQHIGSESDARKMIVDQQQKFGKRASACSNPFSMPKTMKKLFRQLTCCPLYSTNFVTSPSERTPRCQFFLFAKRSSVTEMTACDAPPWAFWKAASECIINRKLLQWYWKKTPQIVVLFCSTHHGVGLSTMSDPRISQSLLWQSHLHGKIRPTLLGQPLDSFITLPTTPNFCWRCLVFWLGSCSYKQLVDFQSVCTLRHSDFFRENILGNAATAELSLISLPFK